MPNLEAGDLKDLLHTRVKPGTLPKKKSSQSTYALSTIGSDSDPPEREEDKREEIYAVQS